MRKKLTELIKRHEGYRQFAYRDTVGKLTIGIGRNIDDRGISEDESEYMLNNDIDICMSDLSRNIPGFNELPETVQIVLVDMCFNLGIVRLMKFKKTLLYIHEGLYYKAADEMLDSSWARQVGTRATELSEMMRHAHE